MTDRTWRGAMKGVGGFDAVAQAKFIANRDAFLAASHLTLLAEDTAITNALFSALNTLIDVFDPGNTAVVQADVSVSVTAGYQSFSCNVHLLVDKPGAAGGQLHNWQAHSSARLTAPELALVAAVMAADISSQELSTSAQDTGCLNAALTTAQSIWTLVDPSATAAVLNTCVSGQVSVGNYDKVSLSLLVSSIQPQPADTTLLTCRKTTPQQSTVVALADVSEMSATLEANSTYRFEYNVLYRSAGATAGIGLAVNGPASPAAISYIMETPIAADGPAANFHGAGTAYNDTTLATAVPAINTDYVARVEGVVRTGAAGGPFVLRFRSETAGTAVTIQPHSVGVFRKVP